jgi:flagellar motor switch protein FliN/FliY
MSEEQAPAPAAPDPFSGDSMLDQASIDDLLKQAIFEAPASSDAGGGSGGSTTLPPLSPMPSMPDAGEFRLPNFQQTIQDAQVSSIELLRDVELNVKIELGRARMLVEDVLRLTEGSVVELDKLAGDPVDVFVNDRLVARGEVLVLNDNFCVRVNEIVAGVKEEGM